MKEREINSIKKGILAGDRAALSKGITLLESHRSTDREKSAALLNSLSHTNQETAFRIAITGSPGVGKSSFIASLGKSLLDKGYKIAILTIDPSSHVSGGSLLGDKTRMKKLISHENVFIRPSPNRNKLGGISGSTKESILLCEAANYKYILIETVGVGQSEYYAKYLSDFFVLLLQPGAGDELQGIKRGILETADLLLINKSDGEMLREAKLSKLEYKNALGMMKKAGVSNPEIILTSTIDGRGVKEVEEILENQFDRLKKSGALLETRKKQEEFWFEKRIPEVLLEMHNSSAQNREFLDELVEQLRHGTCTLLEAIEKCRENINIQLK